MSAIETISAHRCFDGTLGYYKHASSETKTAMKFSVFVPSQAAKGKVPALYFLAGLTCTEETFMIKAGAQRFAAQHGIMLVACDTSPRGLGLPGEDADWDFGTGAGFYLDATAEPWAGHYRMFSYVNTELPGIVEANFPALPGVRGISGHSMGGHGALTIGLREPARWRSVSAFAPISNPVAVPWGEKAFGNYLGPDRAAWKAWDASELMRKAPREDTILVEQGMSDQFLTSQLHPEALEQAAAASGQKLILNRRDGYDHSYWFIQSFVADHIAFHAKVLKG